MMVAILTVLAEVAEQMSPPVEDWWARGIAAIGVALSGAALLRLHLEARRKRAAGFPDTLREHVEILLNTLVGATQRAERLSDLNTTSSGFRIEELTSTVPKLADRRLRHLVEQFCRAVSAARVGQREPMDAPLTHGEMERVSVAIGRAKQVTQRLDRLARMAPG